MSLFPDYKTFIRIAGFDIAWYAILIMTGAIIAFKLTQHQAEKRGIDRDVVEEVFYGALFAGVIGARLWFVLFYPDKSHFIDNPMKILAFRDGGLAIQGGLFGGAAYAYFASKKYKFDFIDLADATLPNILIAQAIGRWGNFLNQEAFGQVVSESFYNGWPQWFKNHMFINGAFRQPTFFFESTLNILGFILIYFVFSKIRKMKKGDYAYSYLLWYGIVRFIVEHFRSDSLMLFNLKSAQIVSIGFIVVGLLGLAGVLRRRYGKDVLVLFDFDNTLADSNGVIIDSFREVFENNYPEIEITRAMEVSFVGPTLSHTFKKYFKEDNVDKYVQEYKKINFIAQKNELKELNNATKLLKYLKHNNVKMGLVSSKMKDSLQLGVDILGFGPYMDIIVGGDEVVAPKPDPQGILDAKAKVLPNAKHFFYVGDTVTDVLAAKASGATSIALLGVKEIREDIINSKPDYIVEDLSEIIEIIKEVI